MKKWYAIPAVAGALVLGGVAFAVSAEKGEIISTDAAKTKAVEAVGGQVKEVELDRELSGDVYEVEVESNGVEYDLDLDAITGEVKKKEVDNRDDRGENRDDDMDEVRDDISVQASEKQVITQEQAIAIAMKSAKGNVTEIELDEDDNQLVYEIEIRDGQMEYDFEIDAVTGAMLKFDQEQEND